MSLYELQSASLWQSLSESFVKNRMSRYVPVYYLADSLVSFSLWQNPPNQLIEIIKPSV